MKVEVKGAFWKCEESIGDYMGLPKVVVIYDF